MNQHLYRSSKKSSSTSSSSDSHTVLHTLCLDRAFNYIPCFFCLFVCIAAKPQVMGPAAGLPNERSLGEVPSRILINSSWCDTRPVANSCNQHFFFEGDITLGGHPSKYWLSHMLLHFCTQIEGTGVSTSLGRWLWNALYVRTLMWYKSPDPKPSSNSDLPVAGITGPATDPSMNFLCVSLLS
jgi:hypothetical protein